METDIRNRGRKSVSRQENIHDKKDKIKNPGLLRRDNTFFSRRDFSNPLESRSITSLRSVVSDKSKLRQEEPPVISDDVKKAHESLNAYHKAKNIDQIAKVLANAFEARNLPVKKWKKLYEMLPRNRELYKIFSKIIEVCDSVDKKNLEKYFDYIKTLNNDTKIDVNYQIQDELETVVTLFSEQMFNDIIQGNFKFPQNKEYLIEYVHNVSQKIIDVIKDNHFLDNWDPEKAMNLLLGTMNIVSMLCIPDLIHNLKLEAREGKYVKHFQLFQELLNISHFILYNVAQEVIGLESSPKINEFETCLNSFDKKYVRRYGFPTVGEISNFSKLIVQYESYVQYFNDIIIALRNNRLLPLVNEKLKSNSWILDYPYKSYDTSNLKLSGEIVLVIHDRTGNTFGFHYDSRNHSKGVYIKNDADNDIKENSFYIKLMNAEDGLYKLLDNRHSAGFNVDYMGKVNTYFIDTYSETNRINKDELKNIGNYLFNLGNNLFSAIDIELPGVLGQLDSCNPLHIIINEQTGRCKFIGSKKFFQKNMDNILKIAKDENKANLVKMFSNIVEGDDDVFYSLSFDITSLFKSGVVIKEDNKVKDEKSESDLAYEQSLIEKEYLDKILKYIRQKNGANVKKVSLSWFKEFLKPLGGVKINDSEGKGDHSKLRLQVKDDGFWVLSPEIIKEGIYLSSIGTIISDLKLTNQEVYEICIKRREE